MLVLQKLKPKKKFKKIEIFSSNFRPLRFSLSKKKEKVFVKLIVNSLNNKVVGLHYLGEHAAEIVQGFSVAIVNGLTKKAFDKQNGFWLLRSMNFKNSAKMTFFCHVAACTCRVML